MDETVDIPDVARRLKAAFAGQTRLVFWEDEGSEYAEALEGIELNGAAIIDATHHELATKRRVLRTEPGERFVIYRSGGAPNPADDLLLDLKLASVPFVCSLAGSWADECGIPATLAESLQDLAAFFRSKERRRALAASSLPKDAIDQVRFAMCAAALRAADGNPRDAARSMASRAIVEWSRGDEAGMRVIAASGLSTRFWAAMRELLGYEAPDGEEPSVGDLAFRMLEGACGDVMDDPQAADPAESARVLGGLAREGRTREAFDAVVREYAGIVARAIPLESRIPDALADVDAIPQADEWILGSFLADELSSGLNLPDLEGIWSKRRYMLFADQYESHYRALLALARFRGALSGYKRTRGEATCLKELVDSYVGGWEEVDRRYREFFLARSRMRAGRFKDTLAPAVARIEKDYDAYLADLTERWQRHLMDEGDWPPASVPSQLAFFHDNVELAFPKDEPEGRVGVIVSDALRFEAGRDLATRLAASKARGLAGRAAVSCSAALCMLPSYTQLGMAALLPDGKMEIDPSDATVRKSGMPTRGIANRQTLLTARVPGSVCLKAEDVLEASSVDLEGAPVALIYHNAIDKTGDSRETEGHVFEAVERTCAEVESLTQMLVRAGCGTVVVTSDHGFLYQSENPESYAYTDVEGLAAAAAQEGVTRTRRFVIGRDLPRDESLAVYEASDLSLQGDYEVAMPRGITRLRLQGSGARFVHGGASAQEDVIPVITVRVAARTVGARPTGVEGFPVGRPVITGSMVSLIVYQTRACGDAVTPLTVKVGVYTDDGALLSSKERTLELDSSSTNVEERKTRVSLRLTDEVDEHSSAMVRISARVGSTSRFETAWEKEYAVSRAFGSDF